jgi:hypothetical protein
MKETIQRSAWTEADIQTAVSLVADMVGGVILIVLWCLFIKHAP